MMNGSENASAGSGIPVTSSTDPMVPVPFQVASAHEELPGCYTFDLRPTREGEPASFAPGQFYMIYVFGHGEVPISVSGDPAETGRLTFTVMAVGSVTRALCALKAGQCVGLRGPFGSHWPMEEASGRDLLIIAGGLGLAPLRPVIYSLLSQRPRFGRTTLLYGTRMPLTRLYTEEWDQWAARGDLEAAVTVDSAGRDWRGRVGVVTELIPPSRPEPERTLALVCGPETMMRFTAYALLDLGLKPGQIYLSMERNMKCAVAHCGRCQYGPYFICREGPVFSFDRVSRLFSIREV